MSDILDLTLNEEVSRICVHEGGYPQAWPRHAACVCCCGGPLAYAFSKQGFAHDQCRACDFVCVNPFPPDDILRKLYAGSYYTRTRELFEAARIRSGEGGTPFTAPEGLIEAMVARASGDRAHGTWLDVGGGLGTVANLVRRRRPGWSVALNEFNPRSLELARELYDLPTIADDAAALAARDARFDVISAVSVLEHIVDPVAFIRDYARLLAPGGVIALLVPQFTALNAAVSKGSSPVAAPPFHVSLFRESALRVALERAGGFVEITIEQDGQAAFSLLQHYDYSDYWDITIPTPSEPTPKSLMLRAYPLEMQVGINALAAADAMVADHFAETDGRQYLAAYATVPR